MDGGGMGMYGMGMGPMGGCMGFHPMGGMGGGPMGFAGPGCMGMGSDALFKMMLQGSVLGQASSEMMLLLPNDLLHLCLIPQGHLAEIAHRCEVRIDLRADVTPSQRQVALTGTVVANSMAAYFLQERAFQHFCKNAASGCSGCGGGATSGSM